jgi:predicted AlkP superfamily pyrophosphatase or phosphodiesterase
MKHILAALALLCLASHGQSQPQPQPQPQSQSQSKPTSQPKLIIGIVVDQMRWDFLHRYSGRYGSKGFNRLMKEGFSCENTMIPYAPTVTACGHACIYTGSVPAVHGITGNNWRDNLLQKEVYCTEDKSVLPVGRPGSSEGQMSPRNMLSNTIGDELRLSNNFRSKVIGLALKDRGGILPAGHSANAAYWYDGATGNFVSSTYYKFENNVLPEWMRRFNERKMADSLLQLPWNMVDAPATYRQSSGDEKKYEGKYKHENNTSFPHRFDTVTVKKYDLLRSTPWGNTLTFAAARAAIEGENLGNNTVPDMLAVSFSSPDLIGHQFGPNSIETEDCYLRLDREMGQFLDYLDKRIGKGQYLIFLSADHGVAHVPGFLEEHRLPGGLFDETQVRKQVNQQLKAQFEADSLLLHFYNYQYYLNTAKIAALKLDEQAVLTAAADALMRQEAVAQAFPVAQVMMQPMPEVLRERLAAGYYATRSGKLQVILKPQYIYSWATGTTHGVWNPFDAHIPLVWFGWKVKPGRLYREVYMTDIAPTLAAMLQVQMPNGCVGKVIEEVAAAKQ